MTVLTFLPQEHLILIIINRFKCESGWAILMELRQFEGVFDRSFSFPSDRLPRCIQIWKEFRELPICLCVTNRGS